MIPGREKLPHKTKTCAIVFQSTLACTHFLGTMITTLRSNHVLMRSVGRGQPVPAFIGGLAASHARAPQGPDHQRRLETTQCRMPAKRHIRPSAERPNPWPQPFGVERFNTPGAQSERPNAVGTSGNKSGQRTRALAAPGRGRPNAACAHIRNSGRAQIACGERAAAACGAGGALQQGQHVGHARFGAWTLACTWDSLLGRR